MNRHIRVLHVVGRMNRGGAETWLLQMARAMVGEDVRFDFLVHNPEPGAYDAELRSLGCRIIPCPIDRTRVGYAQRLARILSEYGPFDVVHSHVHHFSGVVLAIARLLGIPIRIAHSHNAPETSGLAPTRRLYLAATEVLLRRSATAGLSVSEVAATSLFGPQWRRDPRWRIQYCSIDVERYRTDASRSTVREALALDPGSLVVGHVGRFDRQKNHTFLVDVFLEVKRLRADAQLVLVGDGPLRPRIEDYVLARGLTDSVSFLGLRSDIAELMACAMDVFVMPSLHEGLPLVTLEAQSTGLPMVLANTITAELVAVPELVRWHSLQDGPNVWATTIVEHALSGHVSQEAASAKMLQSPFSLRTGVAALRTSYGL